MLTPKQTRFVAEYLIDLNATQAAIRCGYSAKTAQPAASRLLSNVMVQDAVRAATARQLERLDLSAALTLEAIRLVNRNQVAIGVEEVPDVADDLPSYDPRTQP